MKEAAYLGSEPHFSISIIGDQGSLLRFCRLLHRRAPVESRHFGHRRIAVEPRLHLVPEAIPLVHHGRTTDGAIWAGRWR